MEPDESAERKCLHSVVKIKSCRRVQNTDIVSREKIGIWPPGTLFLCEVEKLSSIGVAKIHIQGDLVTLRGAFGC